MIKSMYAHKIATEIKGKGCILQMRKHRLPEIDKKLATKKYNKFNEIGHLQTLFDFQDGNQRVKYLSLRNDVKEWQLWNHVLPNKEICHGNNKIRKLKRQKGNRNN